MGILAPWATTHFLGQHLPGNAGLQNEENAGEHRSILQRLATRIAGTSSLRGRQQWLNE